MQADALYGKNYSLCGFELLLYINDAYHVRNIAVVQAGGIGCQISNRRRIGYKVIITQGIVHRFVIIVIVCQRVRSQVLERIIKQWSN